MSMKEQSPVPITPDVFAAEVDQMHFTSQRADPEIVKSLYEKAFISTLSQKKMLVATAWGDEEVEKFLPGVAEFSYQLVVIRNAGYNKKVSFTMQWKLRRALAKKLAGTKAF